jgi:hypothetical protein
VKPKGGRDVKLSRWLAVGMFMFAWFCQWHGQEWGPFATYESCMDYNRVYFNYSGYCHWIS